MLIETELDVGNFPLLKPKHNANFPLYIPYGKNKKSCRPKGVEILKLSWGHYDDIHKVQIMDAVIGRYMEFNVEEMDKYVFNENIKLSIL